MSRKSSSPLVDLNHTCDGQYRALPFDRAVTAVNRQRVYRSGRIEEYGAASIINPLPVEDSDQDEFDGE